MDKKFDKLSISFENVECIDIDKKQIKRLFLGGVHTFDSYDYSYGIATDRFKMVTTVADRVELVVDIDGLQKGEAERLAYSDNIDGIGLHYQGDPNDKWTMIDVPWCSKRNCETSNLYQSVERRIDYSIFDKHPELVKTWPEWRRKRRREAEKNDPFLNHQLLRIIIEKY